MKISRKWLEDFVPIPRKLSGREFGEKMTLAMAEVEGVVEYAKLFDGVVVGEVVQLEQHPEADRLKVAKVRIGSKNTKTIICGAPNIAPGQKVAVATVGTTLPNGMTIEERPLRGITSSGMICAEDELGLGPDHEGIMVLDERLKPGTLLVDALGLDDTVLEIDNKSLTHRPDLWGHYGIARDVAAFLDLKLKPYQPKTVLKEGTQKLSVTIQDQTLCQRYMGVVVEGITIKPSPDWLRRRLEACGVRSINAIVDITNYVMLEIGQPMHAFDYDKLAEHTIVVRPAKEGETIETLDGKVRDLNDSMLVIADAETPIAIAGLMGGAATEISERTTKIIFESANFDHITIRKTSQDLGLRSESSQRFEKSLDPHIAELALRRALELVAELYPKATLVTKIVDKHKIVLNQGPITTSTDFIQRRIGNRVPEKTIISILTRLGFEVKNAKGILNVTVPTWRATKDVAIPEDLVEEVARVYGYGNLNVSTPSLPLIRPQVNELRRLQRRATEVLAFGSGMSEVITYSFVSDKQMQDFGFISKDFVQLANPLDTTRSHMRRSLVPNLMDAINSNMRYFDSCGIFEFGRVYLKEEKGERSTPTSKNYLPKQDTFLSGAFCSKGVTDPFFNVKESVASVITALGMRVVFADARDIPEWADAARAQTVTVAGEEIGIVTELKPSLQTTLDCSDRVGIFELNFSRFVGLYADERQYVTIPKFPAIRLDISMLIPADVSWKEIHDAVMGEQKELIKSVELFDVYAGKGIPAGRKSIAFTVEYRSDERTLEHKEIDGIHDYIRKLLEKKFGAELR